MILVFFRHAELVSASLRLRYRIIFSTTQQSNICVLYNYIVSILPLKELIRSFTNYCVLCLPLSDLSFAGDRFYLRQANCTVWFMEIKDYSD